MKIKCKKMYHILSSAQTYCSTIYLPPQKIIYWNYDVTYNLLELDKVAAQISSFPFILMIVLYVD